MLKLINFSVLALRKRHAAERNEALERRLQLFKDKKDREYRELVIEQHLKDAKMAEQVMKVLMEELFQASKLEFALTMKFISEQPQILEMLNAAMHGKYFDEDAVCEKQPALDKEKTLKAFELTNKLKIHAVKKEVAKLKHLYI